MLTRSTNTLSPGTTRVGFLRDNAHDRLGPLVGMLSVTKTGEITLHFPFLRPNAGAVQPDIYALHNKAATWGRNTEGSTPETLGFQDDRGTVILTGVRWAGNTIGTMGRALFRVESAFLGEPSSVDRKFDVTEMESELDGLHEFAQFQLWRWNEDLSTSRGDIFPMVISEPEPITWNTGEFTFEIKPHWETSALDGSYASIHETTRIVTRTSAGTSIFDHLQAQRAIRAFLVLNFGRSISWRGHWALGHNFKKQTEGSERRSGDALIPVVLEKTLREATSAKPTWRDLTLQAVSLRQLSAESLERWTDSYVDEEDFRRAVDPAVEAIASTGGIVETKIMTLAAALDFFAFSYLRKRKPRLSDQLTWCLDAARIDWPSVGNNAAIGKMLADVNNDLKHADRRSSPDPVLLRATLRVMEVAARGQLLKKLEVSDEVFEWFCSLPAVANARDAMRLAVSSNAHTEERGS